MKTIYTDGSCKGNPGPGGWAVVIIDDSHLLQKFGGFDPTTTNNRMELSAAIAALKLLDRNEPATIFTDSEYVKLGITQWLITWKMKGWKTANKQNVKNQDLWQALNALNHSGIIWKYVAGHSGNDYNELCDKIAKGMIDSQGRETDLLK
jgi:ribonuclease HI